MADNKETVIEEVKVEEGASDASKTQEVKKSKSIVKLALFIGLPLLILGGAGAFLFLTETGHHLMGKKDKEPEPEKEKPETLSFFTIPEMMVNLLPNGKKTPFLRLGLKLELPNAESQKAIDSLLPRIIDQYQMYLRGLRVEDIENTAGIHRLREELLKRVYIVTNPIKIKIVLIQVMLVQ